MITAAFLGTPDAAVPCLRALAGMGEVPLVITRPDQPRGRGRRVAPSPVKKAALEMGLPVQEVSQSGQLSEVLSNRAMDVGVVVAFGLILPQAALEIPAAGMVNVHFSVLPRWRGAAPVERAILAGDTHTGVSLMAMDEGLDTGGVYHVWKTPIGAQESGGELTDRLAQEAARRLETCLEKIVSGEMTARPQEERLATYAPRIKAEEAQLDFGQPAQQILRTVRALHPRPGAHTFWEGTSRFKILAAQPDPSPVSASLAAGEIRPVAGQILVGTADAPLELLIVQPAGKRPMSASDWWRGVRGGVSRFS